MGNSEHTPGPWIVRKDESDPCYLVIASEDWGTIARLHDPDAKRLVRLSTLEANALLIAMAPAMLKALQRAQRIQILREALSENYARLKDHQITAESRIKSKELITEYRNELRSIEMEIQTVIRDAQKDCVACKREVTAGGEVACPVCRL